MVNCDECGCWVSSTGYLGGGIVCPDCAEEKRKATENGGDTDA